MRRRITVCFVLAFAAVFGTTACAQGGQQQQQEEQQEERIESLQNQVVELQKDVEEIEFWLGEELEEEPQQEQTQQQQTQQERTQEKTQ